MLTVNTVHTARRLPAFTLIEILSVIAIIAILAALIFPVFSRAKAASRKTVCESNLQRWGHAFALYVTDYDETYPKLKDEVFGEGWAGAIWPYVKNKTLAVCPDDPTRSVSHSGITAYPISYALNQSIASGIVSNGLWGPGLRTTLSAFMAPASTVLLLEVSGVNATFDRSPETRLASQQLSAVAGVNFTSDGHHEPTYTELDWTSPPPPLYATGWNYGAEKDYPRYTVVFGRARHGDGANYLLADGHVKWYPPDAVSYGGSNTDTMAGESLPVNPPYHNNYGGLAAGTGGLGRSHKQITMSVK